MRFVKIPVIAMLSLIVLVSVIDFAGMLDSASAHIVAADIVFRAIIVVGCLALIWVTARAGAGDR